MVKKAQQDFFGSAMAAVSNILPVSVGCMGRLAMLCDASKGLRYQMAQVGLWGWEVSHSMGYENYRCVEFQPVARSGASSPPAVYHGITPLAMPRDKSMICP